MHFTLKLAAMEEQKVEASYHYKKHCKVIPIGLPPNYTCDPSLGTSHSENGLIWIVAFTCASWQRLINMHVLLLGS